MVNISNTLNSLYDDNEDDAERDFSGKDSPAMSPERQRPRKRRCSVQEALGGGEVVGGMNTEVEEAMKAVKDEQHDNHDRFA